MILVTSKRDVFPLAVLVSFCICKTQVSAEVDAANPNHTVIVAGEESADPLVLQLSRKISDIQEIVRDKALNRDSFYDEVNRNGELGRLVREAETMVSNTGTVDRGDRSSLQEAVLDVIFVSEEISSDGKRSDGSDETPEEKKAREAAEKRAAKKAADGRGVLRDIEDELERRDREKELERLEQARGRDNEGNPSNGGGGGEPSSPPFNPPSSSNNSNDNSGQNNAIDKLADRIGGLSQPNFNAPTNQNKKSEPEKPKFSLEPSKSSLDKESEESSKPKLTKPSLPELSSANKNSGSDSDIDFVGTPIPFSPPSSSSQGGGGSNGGLASGGAPGGGPAGAGGMGGILAGGQAGFSPMGEGDSGFPFDVTGEAYNEESEYEDWPRFRVFKIPMSNAGGGNFGSFGASLGSSNQGDQDTEKISKTRKNKNRTFYYLTPVEASLEGIPGVFRSMASGFKKTRVQNLCEKFSQLKIGLCQRSKK